MATTRDRLFDAINESYDALTAAIEATEERGHRVSRTVLSEARKGEQEVVALARQWANDPTNVFENLGALVDTQARAQRRALELARDSLTGAGEYGSEVQQALTRVIQANRQATEATIEALRRGVNRVRGTAEPEEAAPPRRAGARARASVTSDETPE